MELNQIGFFQFENLVQNRIPLILVLLDPVDLKPWYNSVVNMHLQNVTLHCSPEQVLPEIQNKKLPPHFAVIILDQNAEKSPAVAKTLEDAGYINVYYVKGGFTHLAKEREQESNR
ncbi:rhodanese-like domain-containing protein [Bdellovibrio sp. 22V]|uniref:rhodanese-like domain-containing protein n=1 Tax=Bdellovibrio sp. 22V TaxID=3044166 RepID=UPI002542738F|nr:rhodanese-like domain-containing protein [Bdellovibrio sp. 22V]WII70614.1 rhodanese-like domain-containing protein [Bdellovibrio sp. 22V]